MIKSNLNIGITNITSTLVFGNVFYYDSRITIVNDSITTNVNRVFNLVLDRSGSSVGNIYNYNGLEYIIVLDTNGNLGVLEYCFSDKSFITFCPNITTISDNQRKFIDTVCAEKNKVGSIFDKERQIEYLKHFNTGKRIY